MHFLLSSRGTQIECYRWDNVFTKILVIVGVKFNWDVDAFIEYVDNLRVQQINLYSSK